MNYWLRPSVIKKLTGAGFKFFFSTTGLKFLNRSEVGSDRRTVALHTHSSS